jgi:nucleoside-diphosphate-sugar epimerase
LPVNHTEESSLRELRSYKALIAGCGYLGQRVADIWVRNGIPVTAVTRSEKKATEFLRGGIHPLLLDLSSENDMRSSAVATDDSYSPDAVVWAVGFDRSSGISREMIWIDGLRRFITLLSGFRTPPRSFVYVSSTGVYGNADGGEVDEFTLTEPVTESGQCCLAAENVLRSKLAELIPECQSVVLRMAGIYGPRRLLRRASEIQSGVRISGNPEDWLNLIHVEDAARAVVAATEQNLTGGWPIPVTTTDPLSKTKILNIVNRDTLTRRQYYTELSRLFHGPVPEFEADYTGEVRIDSGKLEEASAAPGSQAVPQTVPNHTSRRNSGSKRVISRCREMLEISWMYDDVRAGLRHAVETSE